MVIYDMMWDILGQEVLLIYGHNNYRYLKCVIKPWEARVSKNLTKIAYNDTRGDLWMWTIGVNTLKNISNSKFLLQPFYFYC